MADFKRPGRPTGEQFRRPAQPKAPATSNPSGQVTPDGFEARHLAVYLVQAVLRDGKPFDDALGNSYTSVRYRDMAPRDRALARAIAAVTLRRAGQLAQVIRTFFQKPLPDNHGALMTILATAAAQLLIIKSPPHAVLNIAVEQCRHDVGARRFDRLANAVLRRVCEKGPALLAEVPVETNFPPWLWQRWIAHYGEETARLIAEASLSEAALDLTPKGNASTVAQLVKYLLATPEV
jgi:16S rRNA (cytosine967-C5)-methyltransferase